MNHDVMHRGSDGHRELVARVRTLVAERYGGDWAACFRAYAEEDGLLSNVEVRAVLRDAGVGTLVTRPLYARAVVAALDADGDGRVSPAELEAELGREHESTGQ